MTDNDRTKQIALHEDASRYDAIVIGLGGVGSAAAMHLARRGQRVLGLEQFSLGHDRGSSHGQTRVIRQAYFEHPDYVPLLKRSYELWRELQQIVGRQLYVQTGVLEIGPTDGIVVPGVLRSAALHDLKVDLIDRDRFANRFEGFRLPENSQAVFEREAGLLLVEDCVEAHCAQARHFNATLNENETVQSWNSDADRVVVTTDRGTYVASSLVITAGAWSADLLADLGIRLSVLRKHMHWYQVAESKYECIRGAGQGGPIFYYETNDGHYYGFPVIDSSGMKVCEHSGGELIQSASNADRSSDKEDRQRVDAFLTENLSDFHGTHQTHRSCLYTVSSDENFIVDMHPKFSNVAFAAGLSGHGFKFTPVLGEILAGMVIFRCRQPSAEFLSIDRLRS